MRAPKKQPLGLIRGAYLGLLLSGVAAAAFFGIPAAIETSYHNATLASSTSAATTTIVQHPSITHVPTPDPVKAIYMSQCAAGTPSFRKDLLGLIDRTELNAIVIDIKDYSGGIAFPTDSSLLRDNVSKACGAADMKSFVKNLHDKGIYVIGRITVFQDPTYTKEHPDLAVQSKKGGIWKNYGGLSFVDVGAKPFWDYIVELSKVSYEEMGFDELNFDYIRFPSDGPMADAVYMLDEGKTKAQALEEFFQYLHAHVKQIGAVMSADLFGYVTVHVDDLGIGQVLERAMPYFDFIDPMVYPSHYNSGFVGLKNVNSDPYKVVRVSLDSAVARAMATTTELFSMAYTPIMKTVEVAGTTTPTTTRELASGLYSKPAYPASIIRPWLQSFDYPVTYTPDMVKEQIQANLDSGLNSYLIWDAANKYTSLRTVLAREPAASTTAAQ